MKRGKHMNTGYLDGTTSQTVDLPALGRRVARLEAQLAEQSHQAAVRRMWLGCYAYWAYMAIAIAVIVYLAGSLD